MGFRPPPGLSPPASRRVTAGSPPNLEDLLGVAVDTDGIARLVTAGNPENECREATAPASRTLQLASLLDKPGGSESMKPPPRSPTRKLPPGMHAVESTTTISSASPSRTISLSSRLGSAAGSGDSLASNLSGSPMRTLLLEPEAVDSSAAKSPLTASAQSRVVISHGPGDAIDEVTLHERIRKALTSCTSVEVHLTGHCTESQPIEVSEGEVVMRGPPGCADKIRLNTPGLRVSRGGSLIVRGVAICATEENRVQGGRLECADCLITARNGCGVLCLQKAHVQLTGCEICGCSRSGVGVNGKHTQIEITDCVLKQNNYSGLGVNHQARLINLKSTRIVDNKYHGVWLNAGVVAQWQGGELHGNLQGNKAGPGLLQGFVVE
eukprot:gnl/TRDRNA2_/TRDRNA2_83550_c0_seq4.p1 gnl/TRDRNA2_/TRDRNA2_83550_c0~~gnl/TRDRNA2_/TRDRNA2_83550_c0_seq4.p1  ORF type:complete len:381 (-),score=60.37 gnl/TRDRNA2_/TRDRNA2_83550_c0_seq4:132-1274(-)